LVKARDSKATKDINIKAAIDPFPDFLVSPSRGGKKKRAETPQLAFLEQALTQLPTLNSFPVNCHLSISCQPTTFSEKHIRPRRDPRPEHKLPKNLLLCLPKRYPYTASTQLPQYQSPIQAQPIGVGANRFLRSKQTRNVLGRDRSGKFQRYGSGVVEILCISGATQTIATWGGV
jgi:hypothetical protein